MTVSAIEVRVANGVDALFASIKVLNYKVNVALNHHQSASGVLFGIQLS